MIPRTLLMSMRFSIKHLLHYTTPALLCCVLCPFLASAQSLGQFQSTLDSRTYEVRQRGQSGLDIYTDNGVIAATLDKKKASDRSYKGQTQSLATSCPGNAGKIEVLQVTPDRIQARVELPSKNIGNQMACNMAFLNRWQTFDLIKQGGPITPPTEPTPTQPPTPPTQPGDSKTVERNGVRYELQNCAKEDQRIVCTMWVTNTSGTDDHLFSPENTEWQFYIDNLGNRVNSSSSTLGNTITRSKPLVLPSLRMPLHVVFEGINEQATTLVRLVFIAENRIGRATVQFDNIPLQNPDQSGGGDADGRTLTRDNVRYRLQSCRHESADLVCLIEATNLSSTDQHVNWFPEQSFAIDQSGNRFQAAALKLRQQPIQRDALLPPHAAVPITVTFAGANTTAQQLARLEIGGDDGSPVTLRYSGVPIEQGR